MATNPLGAPYNVLFKNATDGTVGDDNLKYMYDASQPFLEIGGAASADKGMIQLGGATGSGEIKSNQVQITSAGTLVFQFPTVAVNIDPTGNILTPANVVAFEGTDTKPINVTSQSSVQLFTGAGANQPSIAWVDKSRPVDDRVAFSQFSAGKLSFNFANDAFTGSNTWLSASGGVAGGITAITSNSGTGSWTHSGAMRISWPATPTAPTLTLDSSNPVLAFFKGNNGTNMRNWYLTLDGSGNLFTGTATDAGVYTQNAVQITRTGTTVTSHRLFVNGAMNLTVDSNGISTPLIAYTKGLSAANSPAQPAGPSNSGFAANSSTNYGGMSLYDSTQAANARGFNLINFQNKVQFRLINDTGANVIVPLSFNGGFAGYTGMTFTGNETHAGNILHSAPVSTYADPMVQIYSTGAATNNPLLVFNAGNGPDTDRKKWFISGNNGNFFSYGIQNDAGTTNYIAYQAYRGNGTVGGHQWFLGNQGVTTGSPTPSMFLSNNVFSLMPGVQMVMGDTVPINSSVALMIKSTTSGFLPPVMTTTQMKSISGAPDGLVVYNSTVAALCLKVGAAWYPITAGAPVPDEEPIEE